MKCVSQVLHFSFRVNLNLPNLKQRKARMVSETELTKGARKSRISKALVMPAPQQSSCYNTLVVLGVIMILSGYGFAGYMIYKRLQDMELQIKKASSGIEIESEQDLPELEDIVAAPAPAPAPAPHSRKKKLVTFDVDLDTEPEPEPEPHDEVGGIETLDPLDDL
jgi:hypothetical protein